MFSIAGLAAAAATTRFVFPVIAPNGAPGAGFRRQLGRFMAAAAALLPRARVAVVLLAALAVGALAVVPSPWRGELASLSPVPAADLALDAALRADLGAADAGTLVAVSAASEQGALAAAEAVGTRLDTLVASRRPARLRLAGAAPAEHRDADATARRAARQPRACAAGSPRRPSTDRCPRRG